MKLIEKKYTYQELKAFKEDTERHNDLMYLLENVNALRILGWRLTLGKKIPHDKINGYTDVIKYSPSLGNKIILSKEKESKTTKQRKMITIKRRKNK